MKYRSTASIGTSGTTTADGVNACRRAARASAGPRDQLGEYTLCAIRRARIRISAASRSRIDSPRSYTTRAPWSML